MDRLLARLERRFGRFAIPQLPAVLVAGMAIMFVIQMTRPDLMHRLTLDWAAVRRGEIWRLVTYFFFPNNDSPFFILFSLMFTWMVASSLDREWGSFRFNVFYLVGALATTGVAIVFGGANNVWMNVSMFLAFATLYPNAQLFLLIIPIRAKWLALIMFGLQLRSALPIGLAEMGAIGAALLNYLLFFAGHWVHFARSRNLQVRQAARRADMGPPVELVTDRSCALCGKTQSGGADIRVCSCAKCGEPRNLCLEHARNH